MYELDAVLLEQDSLCCSVSVIFDGSVTMVAQATIL